MHILMKCRFSVYDFRSHFHFPSPRRRRRHRCRPPRGGDGPNNVAGALVRLRDEHLELRRHLVHARDPFGARPHHVLAVAAVQVPPPPAQHRQEGTLCGGFLSLLICPSSPFDDHIFIKLSTQCGRQKLAY